jgi:uncharacterized protein (TIGR04255 family)
MSSLDLKSPPIIEAVLDIDCDLPPTFDLAALGERAASVFGDQYPKRRQQSLHEAQFKIKGSEEPKVAARHRLQALQFLATDGRQIVQVRKAGFSFNRLAPYSSLDDYLPEIERTWRLFLELAEPAQIRRIGLRYINRLLLPLSGGRVQFDDYLKISPRLPDGGNLEFVSFLRQHVAREKSTGNEATIVLTTQPASAPHLPVIFDNAARRREKIEPGDWETVRQRIDSLRSLKNRVFQNTLTEQCLRLFQQ